jgi:REP element-mobilizing transposase RayT
VELRCEIPRSESVFVYVGRDLRHIPKGDGLVEVTDRCFQSRFLLRPSPALNAAFVGALARAARRHGVGVVDHSALSNHYHLLLVCHEPWRLAAFMRDFKSKLAKEIQRLHGWSGIVFPHRYRPIPVSDEPEAQIARLRYLLEQGVKEGLVASPLQWPGAHGTKALLTGRSAAGHWVDRTAQFRALQRGENAGERAFTTDEELELVALPCWSHLEPAERQAEVLAMVRDIEAQARERARTTGRTVLGRREVLRQDPHSSPAVETRSPAPRFHAASKRVRQELLRSYYAFLDAYRTAAEALRAGRFAQVRFPPGAIPPPLAPVPLRPG